MGDRSAKVHVLFTIAALSTAFGACSGREPERAPPEEFVAPSPAPLPPAPIETLSQSLESASFVYSASEHRVRVTFSRVESTSEKVEESPAFEGRFTGENWPAEIELEAPEANDYAVRVACPQADCHSATIRISKAQGKFAGEAVIERSSPEFARSMSKNTPLGSRTSSSDPLTSMLAEFLSRENLTSEPTLSILTPKGGRFAWFELHYLFLPTPIMSPGQLGYYDDKVLTVTGRIGTRVPVTLARTVVRDGTATTTKANVPATATMKEDSFSLRIERPSLGSPTIGARVSEN